MQADLLIAGDAVAAADFWWDSRDGAPPPPSDAKAWRNPDWAKSYDCAHGRVEVQHIPAEPWDRGWCSCGWAGVPRHVEMAAWADVLNHLDPAWATAEPRRWDRDWKPTKKTPTRPTPDSAGGLPFVRTPICGERTDHDDTLGLCRGSIPLPVLEMCSHAAHWDLALSRAWRAQVDGTRARRTEERHRLLVHANAPLATVVAAEGGIPARPPETFESGACDDGDHLFCRWTGCVCPCHSAWFLPQRAEAQRRYGSNIVEGWVRLHGPPAPPPPPPVPREHAGQLALF